MPSPRHLKVDGRALLDALTAREAAVLGSYLDLRTGAVFQLLDPALTGADNEAIEAAMDQEPGRFARIPLYEREYRLMCAFVEQVDDEELASDLDQALRGRGAFNAFHQRLGSDPAVADQWADHRQQALVRWAIAWLATLGVVPEWEVEEQPAAPTGVQLHHLLALGSHPPDPDGVVRCALTASSAAEARRLFKRFARQLCDYRGEPWRSRYVRDLDSFERDGVRLRQDGERVELELRVEPAVLARFGLTRSAVRGT